MLGDIRLAPWQELQLEERVVQRAVEAVRGATAQELRRQRRRVMQMPTDGSTAVLPARGLRLQHMESREETPLDSNASTSCGESNVSDSKEQASKAVQKRRNQRNVKMPKSCAPPLQVQEQNERSIQKVEEVEKLFTEDKTTVMIRNIPSCYNCEEFLSDVIVQHFDSSFVLPSDRYEDEPEHTYRISPEFHG
eukprot:Skav207752  [mRNA]  locus=scaffold181:107819:111885:- [translate_table: standard]